MKKNFTLSMALILATAFYAAAQDFHPAREKTPPQKPTVECPKVEKPTVKQITEDWWEPDTICCYNVFGEDSRQILSYNEKGYRERGVRQKKTEDNEEWINSTQHFYTYDEKNNLLTILKLDWNNDEWKNSFQYIYTYDERSNLLVNTELAWRNDEWEEHEQYAYTYDERNNLLTKSYSRWSGAEWTKHHYYAYTYDERDNLLSYLYQLIDYDEVLKNKRQYLYSYDEEDNLLTVTEFYWIEDKWKKITYYSCTYDERDNLLTELYQEGEDNENYSQFSYSYDEKDNLLTDLRQYWENNEWGNSSQYFYTYTERNNLSKEVSQWWNENEWENYEQTIYAYDERGNLLESIYQNWNENEWENRHQRTYYYDERDNLLLDLFQSWSNNQWAMGTQYIYTYDERDNLLRTLINRQSTEYKHDYTYDEHGNGILAEFWIKNEENVWIEDNGIRKVFYNNMQSFLQLEGSKITVSYVKAAKPNAIEEEKEPEFFEISVFPNPTTGKLVVDSGKLIVEKTTLFDIFGRKVLETKETSFDIGALPAGLYILQIKTEQGITRKKIVKQ